MATGKFTKTKLDEKLKELSSIDDGREVRAFTEKCRNWCDLDDNKDGRGVKREVIERACRGCGQLKSLLRSRKHEDPTLRRQAGKLMTGMRHRRFPEILEALKKFRGLQIKAGRRIADDRRRSSERTLGIDDRYELKQLCSKRSLQCAGNELGNCVAGSSMAGDYLKEVQEGDSELWALKDRHGGRTRCLMKVDTSPPRQIVECGGRLGKTPKLRRSVAFGILDKLDANGDDVEAFARVGAFHALRDGRPTVEPVDADVEGCRYRIWILRDGAEIVIQTRPPSEKRPIWSRITLDEDGEYQDRFVCMHEAEISIGRLLRLMVCSPPLYFRMLSVVDPDALNSAVVDHLSSGEDRNEDDPPFQDEAAPVDQPSSAFRAG